MMTFRKSTSKSGREPPIFMPKACNGVNDTKAIKTKKFLSDLQMHMYPP